jgi:hypothetical protein
VVEGEQREDVHMLIVTGPLRDRLFERFSRLYANADDVRVVKDRRYGERRHTPAVPSDDRRRSDRRQRPAEWLFPPETV